MAQTAASGRHRAPGRHNPLTEITSIVARAGDTGVKASAVLAASGGLVAAFALPAQAAPAVATKSTTSTSAAPAAVATKAAVVAPAVQAPEKAERFGVVGVKAKAKPAPAPVVVAPVQQAAATTTAAPAATTQQASTTSSQAATQSQTRAASTSPASTSAAFSAPAPAAAPASNGSILGIASSLTGIYYIYGGTTPAGFDCSGFTSYVYRQAGISIPRTSSAQQAAATPVSNPQPGDLVFFGFPAYHVGIYAGNGMMIDSPRTGAATALRSIWDPGATFGRF